jgi:hypothetical protein
MTVANTKVDEREVPGSLIGQPDEPSVTADLYYKGKRTLWVEPTTGIIVAGQQEMTQELVAPGEKPGEGTVVFNGKLQLNEKTVNDFVGKAKDAATKISFLTVFPIWLWVGGGLLIVIGLAMLYVRFGRGGPDAVGDSPPLQRQPVGAS